MRSHTASVTGAHIVERAAAALHFGASGIPCLPASRVWSPKLQCQADNRLASNAALGIAATVEESTHSGHGNGNRVGLCHSEFLGVQAM